MRRRITTARQQVDMLSPWRTAMPTTDPWDHQNHDDWLERSRVGKTSTQDIIDDVRAKHGINLEMENTGGGCYVLSGRLEDGSWVRAADHDDFCWPELADRHRVEEERGDPFGWDVSFHSNVHDEGGPYTFPDGKTVDFPPTDYWATSNDGAEPIHWHSDPDARVGDLSLVIGDAFRTMPPDAKRVQQEKLRESLAADGHAPGDEEWRRHFPDEAGGGRAIDVPADPPAPGRGPHDPGDDDYGPIFGMRSAASEDSRWLRERGSWRYPEATQRLMDAVRAATGVRLDMEDTGGRSYVLSGRLEDGSWLTAGDATDGLNWWDARDREGEERSVGPMGWYVALHNHIDDQHGGGWLGGEPYHVHVDEGARNHELPRVVAEALATAPRGSSEGRGPVERGVDYEALLNPPPPGPGDEDFGDIFGDREAMARTAAGDVVLPPDGPHDDWRPRWPGTPTVLKWQPYVGGDTWASYHVYRMGGGNNPYTWGANHHGVCLGSREVQPYHDDDADPLTVPTYSLEHAPENVGYFRTPELAQEAAREHFAETYGGGTELPHPGGHRSQLDSGVDYDRLVNPGRQELGDDYGDIFGKEGALRAAGWSESHQPWADWRRITKKDGNTAYNEWHADATGAPQDTYHHWMAPLENGHELHAWSYRHNPRNEEYGWTWAIRDPHGDETGWDEDNRMWLSGGGPDTPVYDEDEDEDAIYPDLGSAVKKAEEKYRALFPVGGPGTGGHRSEIDSGVDYDRLVNPRHDLDEGYGDIFGKESMRRAAGLFDWKRSEKFHDSDSEFAHLENGDQLGLFSAPPHDPGRGWDWYLWTGPKDEHGNRAVTGGGMGWDGDDRAHAVEHYPTIDHAKDAAEAAYRELHPLGSGSGGGDSGVDYDGLVNPRQDMDDDFGDIFGGA